jgi:uncharacterized membrane protein YbhN (UPF0104 family)
MRFVPHNRLVRLLLILVPMAGLAILAIVRGPDLGLVGDAFRVVAWSWVAAALGINLFSIAVRAVAWKIVLAQALPQVRLRRRNVLAAFSVGLLANAALPGRVGELARVAVLTRHVRRPGAWATITGTVFAHRLFDVVAAVGLVLYVLYTARLPDWAIPGIAIVLGVGLGLLLGALLLARRHQRTAADDVGAVRRILATARAGLAVLHRPVPAVAALVFQLLGWAAQLFAVWAAFRAFQIDGSFAAAGLVLVLMNVVIAFPLWPGSVGLLQAAVAAALLSYGVTYAHGFAYGIGLQAIEASVGIGLGFLFLAREGFTFAMLKRMPEVTEVDVDDRFERVA